MFYLLDKKARFGSGLDIPLNKIQERRQRSMPTWYEGGSNDSHACVDTEPLYGSWIN